MKIRIGVGIGTGASGPDQLAAAADAIVEHRLDSLWLSEVLTGQSIDPLVGLAWAAGRDKALKVGTTMLLPGRHPLRTAKALASLDRLCGGRLLLTAVPGLVAEPERGAIGVAPAGRGQAIDAVLPLLRRLWAGDTVTWSDGDVRLDGVTLHPLPQQDPLEVWLGGTSAAALERCGRLGDGWLPALCTPAAAEAGRQHIEEAASAAGRTISPEHFGISVGYTMEPLTTAATASIARRTRGVDPADVVPVGWPGVRDLLERYIGVGFSKFVLRPLAPPDSWTGEIAAMAGAVGDLQS